LTDFVDLWTRHVVSEFPVLTAVDLAMSQALAVSLEQLTKCWQNVMEICTDELIGKMSLLVDDSDTGVTLEQYLDGLDAKAELVTLAHREKLYSIATKPAGKGLINKMRWLARAAEDVQSKIQEVNDGKCEVNFLSHEVLKRAGKVAASATLLISFWRSLKEKEDRKSLVIKCVRALSPENGGKFLSAHACVSQCLNDLTKVVLAEEMPGGKKENAAVPEPPTKKAKIS